MKKLHVHVGARRWQIEVASITPRSVAFDSFAALRIGSLLWIVLPGLEAAELIHTLGDAHLYKNHLEQARLQLTREPRPLPRVRLNPEVKSIFDFRYEDVTLEGYDPWPAIKAPIAV